jgi:hypothetical protein
MTDTEAGPNVWTFLISIVTLAGVIAAPLMTWLLNRQQTTKITAGQDQLKEDVKQDAAIRAQEVKADLKLAANEIKQETAIANVKIEAVHQVAANTEKLANGDRTAKEQEIKRLRASMRAKGLDPDER